MNQSTRSRGIVAVVIVIVAMFIIFISFALYTMSGLKSVTLSEDQFDVVDSKLAPIAIVDVAGPIMDSRDIIKKLLKAEKDPACKAIIVRVNSPGGAVGPTQEIYEEIRRIDQDIPVYASFGTVAASGGYYIGAAARKIYAPAGAMTGSIGVIMSFMNLSKLYDFAKVQPETIKAGKYKDIGSPARQMSQEERLLLTTMTDDVHEQFIEDILKVRGKKIKGGEKGLREYAQGQIYSGRQALKKGLVDANMGLWQAARDIHKELKLKTEFKVKFIKLKKNRRFIDLIGDIEGAIQNVSSRLPQGLFPLFMSYLPGQR